tara:strand:+ start:40 stop:693 length:654 start_codon:yes stop_codon:yes gene_type:complete
MKLDSLRGKLLEGILAGSLLINGGIGLSYGQEKEVDSGDGVELLVSGDYQNRADYFRYAKQGIARIRGRPERSDLESFMKYVGKWKFDEIDENKKAGFFGDWKGFEDDKKSLLTGAYFDPFSFYIDGIEDKKKFDEFNHAYKFLIEYSGSEDISLEIFGESNDKVIKEYGKKYPWIDLDFANVSDRIIIYENEKGSGFKRFDKGSIKKNARLFSQLK